MSEIRKGQRVKYFSQVKMDDVRGTIVEVAHNRMVIQWDDEIGTLRGYDLVAHPVEFIEDEED